MLRAAGKLAALLFDRAGPVWSRLALCHAIRPSMQTKVPPRFRDRNRPMGPIGGAVSAWVAIACLFLQLAASAACGIGATPNGASAALNQSPFPICHALTGDEDLTPAPGGQHPQPDRHTCPFCSAHCHAAVALAVPGAIVTPYGIAVALADPPAVRRSLSARFAAGAPPRGPPASV